MGMAESKSITTFAASEGTIALVATASTWYGGSYRPSHVCQTLFGAK